MTLKRVVPSFFVACTVTVILFALCCATPSSASATVPKDKTVSITVSAVGDCTLGKDPSFYYGSSLNAMYYKKGGKYFFSGVKNVLSNDDLTIANLEGTITKRGKAANKTFRFRGNPAFLSILTKGSVEAVSFANNHDHDYGTISYNDTRYNLKQKGIKYASYGYVSVYKTDKNVRVGMIAVNDLGSLDSKKLIRKGITNARKRGADVIIVSIHAGIEKENYPSARQKELAHYAVDKGADLVLGHHPHVLQGVQKYKGVYIVYSLGNFCFGGNSNPSDKDTMIFQKTFTFKNGKLQKDKQAKVIPCSVSSHRSYNDYRPCIKVKKEKTRVIKRINTYSKQFGMSFNLKGWANK